MSERRRFAVDAGGARVDRFLADQLPGASRRALADAFADGRIRVDGVRVKKGTLVARGQIVEIEGDVVAASHAPPTPDPDAPLDVLWLDDAVIAVSKPAGQATHPLVPGEHGTLANAVVARYPECAVAALAAREGGAAHRLDAGTTGAVLFARHRAAYEALRAAFHAGSVEKRYLALVVGVVTRDFVVDAPIAQRGARAVVLGHEADDDRGLHARTEFTPRERLGALTLVECVMHTGRMHQVRAHLAHAGTPVLGDATYGVLGADLPALGGHFLHASRLALRHPITGAPLIVEAPLPAARADLLDMLRATRDDA